MAGRYYPQLDIDTFDKFNKELVGDLYTSKDGIINQEVIIYKISAQDTEVNMYGEQMSLDLTYNKMLFFHLSDNL